MFKIKVAVYSGGNSSLLSIRLDSPLRHAQKNGILEYRTSIEEKQHKPDIEIARWCDVAIIQRMRRLRYMNVIKECRKKNKISVYEVDDNFFRIPKGHPEYGIKRHLQYLRCIPLIKNVDAVTVTTENLKKDLLRWNKNIFILPNYVDAELFNSQARSSEKTQTLTVGYVGGVWHRADFHELVPTLQKVLQDFSGKIQLKWIGNIPDELKNFPSVNWIEKISNYEHYAKILSSSRIHIGLAPLKDNLFNRCKSNIKYLEYGICGMAGIYSKLAPYENVKDGETGLIVKEHTPQAWYTAIKTLIENDALREKIRLNAFNDVLKNHLIQNHYMEWYDVYAKLLEEKKQKG